MKNQLDFVGSYRGFEIYAKPVSGATQYIAIGAGGTEIARMVSLAEVMGAIDEAVKEGEHVGMV